MGISSFIGKVFGTEKALEKIVDGVSKGLDALVHTEEEKQQEAAKDRTEARAMVVEWMRATQGQNLARRFLALSITGVWLGQYIAAQILRFIAVFVNDSGHLAQSKLNTASTLMSEGAQSMNSPVMLILAFYFAAPHMGDMAKAVIGKFSNSNKG